MQIEIQGQDAIRATEELLQIEGVQGSYQTLDAMEREGTLVLIAEMTLLRRYCKATQRTQSDVIREFIRSLKASEPIA